MISTVQPSATYFALADQIGFHSTMKSELLRISASKRPPRGLTLEIIGVAAGEAGVEIDAHDVAVLDIRIARLGAGRNVLGVGIITIPGEIDCVLVIKDANDGALGRRLAGARLDW